MKSVPTNTLLLATLRAIGDGVIACDREGCVYMMNPVAEQLTEWTQEDALGRPLKHVFRIVNETTREPVEDPVDKVLRLGTVVGMANHTLLLRPDGTELAIDDSAGPVYNDEGELRGVVLVFRDVTERREAEWNLELLAKSGQALGEATEAASILDRIGSLVVEHFADIAIFDLATPDGSLERHVGKPRLAELEPVAEELYRFVPSPELSAHPTRTALHSGEAVLLPVVTDDAIEAAAVGPEHLEFLRNRLSAHSVLAIPVQADGHTLGVLTFLRNRMAAPFKETDRLAGQELAARIGLALKRAEERRAAVEREALLTAIIESVPVGLLVADPKGRIVLGNRELDQVMRHSLMRSESVQDYKARFACYPDGRRLEAEDYPMAGALLRGEITRQRELLYGPDPATRHWISMSATPVRSPDGALLGGVVAVLDIDQHKRSQALEAELKERLAHEQIRLKTLIDDLPVGVVMAEPSGAVVLGNHEAERIFRHPVLPTGSIEEHEKWVTFHPDGTRVKAEEFPLVRAMRTGLAVPAEQYIYNRGDGTTAWVALSAAPLRDAEGVVFGGVVAVVDIDEQKRTIDELASSRAALSRSTQRFQHLIDRASFGIAIGDTTGGFSYLNPTLLKVLGYSAEEVERGEVRWSELTPAKYLPLDQSAVRQLQSTGHAQTYEKALRAKNGHLVPLLLGATMIPAVDQQDAEDQQVAVFFTDLTKQKQAEAALLQTEKLAAVGKLASTISHEINNPLEAVTNLLFIVRQDKALSQAARDYLEAADRELARVSQVTAQTLRFHRQSTAATSIRPESLVQEVLQLYAARLTNSNIKVRREYAPDVFLTCFEGDIRQVLNNLVGNAMDAMRTGGRMTVRTRVCTRWSTGEEGVCITVADSGSGMTAEVKRSIFDAFYTTKGINGTGLGLWISCRIVHKHKGYVRAYSSVNEKHHGSVFIVWLPLKLASTAREPWHVQQESL